MTAGRDDWLIEGRWYQATIASDPAGLAAELNDIAPAPGRGIVMDAHRNDDTGQTTFGCYAEGRLPLAVVERFVAEARGWLGVK